MTHAAEVALAFFANVGGKEDRDSGHEAGVAKSGGEAKQGGQAGGVVAGSGSEDAGAGFGGFGGDGGGEYGVEVGGEEDVGGGVDFRSEMRGFLHSHFDSLRSLSVRSR